KKLFWEIFFSRDLEFKKLANSSIYPHSRRVESGDLLDQVNNYMIKFFNHFFDEGIAVWHMPNREKGFYAAWKALALYDSDLKLDKHLREWFNQLPDCPEKALIVLLDSLGVKREDWEEYLKASLAALPGWASFIKWRHLYAHIPEYKKYPASKLEYLAVRLCVEAIFLFDYFRVNNIQLTCFEELEKLLGKQVLTKKFKSPEELERERYLFTDEKLKTTLSNLYYADFSLVSTEELALIRAPLNIFLEREPMIWLAAWEDSFQKPIIDDIYRNHRKFLVDGKSILSNSSSLFLNLSKSKQLAQMVFCIDVRSEGIRRCIEADSRIETLGFAGFFGLPISYKEYDSAEFKDACPVLIKPKHFIDEQVHSSCSHKLEQHEYSNSLLKTIFNVYKALKANIASAFIFAEASGPLYMLSMMIRTLTPSLNALLSRISAAIKPKISFEPMLDVKDTVINARSTADEDLSSTEVKHMFTGLAKKEQLLFSEMALRLMGLTQNFAPLVVFSGHGSTTENNPYASALDCGACAGNHGGVNAKALAKILNKHEIRIELAKRGINIPDSTLFIGAEHNTTTDDFEFYDYELNTDEQRTLLAELKESLLQAKKENNAIRQLSFLSPRDFSDSGTAHKRTSSRLRRTNDRSAISSDAEDATPVSYASKRKYKLRLLGVHEDHEDDEN
ncbi:MAG: putative inorganic carbon transporter subunit DabA, partial [bacterium]